MGAQVLMPRSKQESHHRAPRMSQPSNTYWTHIDGLRGFALTLVVIFHVFVGKVSSGVDIFLFIGGLLFVSSQTKNALRPGGISFTQSVIRILRRLYPALIVVISVATVLSLVIMPPAQWLDILHHASAAATYHINWTFISEGSSYARAGSQADVFQHLWSMSIQVQIYLMLLAVITIIVSAMRRSPSSTKVINATVAVLSAASFVYAIYLNNTDQTNNYYNTFSRFWEIGLGSLVGVYLMGKVIMAPWLRWVSTIVGVTLIIGTGIVLDGVNQFPGALTLIPLLGAMMIIFAGTTAPGEKPTWKTMGVVSIFSTAPMLFLGKISYSLYLWHWVLLIIAKQVDWTPDSIAITGTAVIAISVVLAWATHKWVEVPLRQKAKPKRATLADMVLGRYSKKRRGTPLAMKFGAVATTMLVAIVAFSPMVYYQINRVGQSAQERLIDDLGGFEVAYPGAMALVENRPVPEGLNISPSPHDEAKIMLPPNQEAGCFTDFDDMEIHLQDKDGKPCVYGEKDAKDSLYIMGGSHAEMYLPALDRIGKQRHFKVIVLVKMGCAFYQDVKVGDVPYPECVEFTDKVLDYVVKNPPTLGVFTTSTRPPTITGAGMETIPDGYVKAMRKLADAKIPMFLIRDIPWGTMPDGFFKDMRVCVSEAVSKGDDPNGACGQKASDSLLPSDPSKSRYAGIPGITLLDINMGFINKDGWVMPVVGNVLVYRDAHHITNTFAETLTPMIDAQMFGESTVHPDAAPVAPPGEPPAPEAPEAPPAEQPA